MTKLRVQCFGLSLDGYGAGPDQSLNNPLGVGGPGLFGWFFPTRTFHAMTGKEGGTAGIDDDFAVRGFANVGAWILGRNMFGPVRGPWGDGSWRGWWGDEPPYHHPVFVLTHHAREPLEMEGGTTFHFVTDGPDAALAMARDAAGERDVAIAGGANAIQQYLAAGQVDEFEIHVAPILLGAGERLLDNVGDLRVERVRVIEGPGATHLKFRVIR